MSLPQPSSLRFPDQSIQHSYLPEIDQREGIRAPHLLAKADPNLAPLHCRVIELTCDMADAPSKMPGLSQGSYVCMLALIGRETHTAVALNEVCLKRAMSPLPHRLRQ
jgi:hypothetical protein